MPAYVGLRLHEMPVVELGQRLRLHEERGRDEGRIGAGLVLGRGFRFKKRFEVRVKGGAAFLEMDSSNGPITQRGLGRMGPSAPRLVVSCLWDSGCRFIDKLS